MAPFVFRNICCFDRHFSRIVNRFLAKSAVFRIKKVLGRTIIGKGKQEIYSSFIYHCLCFLVFTTDEVVSTYKNNGFLLYTSDVTHKEHDCTDNLTI